MDDGGNAEIITISVEGSDEMIQSSRGKIQKVPPSLLKHKDNRECYGPTTVSLGPYHHGKPQLQLAEMFKETATRLCVLGSGRPIHEFYDKVLELVDEARSCYVEGSTDSYSKDEFAQMMLSDGCFVLYLIDAIANKKVEYYKMMIDHLVTLEIWDVIVDIFLLENQLPFFVVWDLMKIIFQGEEGPKTINNFINYFSFATPRSQIGQNIARGKVKKPLHLLELLRSQLLCNHENGTPFLPQVHKFKQHYIPTKLLYGSGKDFSSSFDSIMELNAKGIHIRPSSSSYFLDVNFKSNYIYGELRLPTVTISPHSKELLLNLIAYEMCPNAVSDMGITSYVRFMKSLINHPNDVKELRSQCILKNFLASDDELCRMFREITIPMYDLDIYEDVKKCIQLHCDNKIRTCMAEVMHKHFSNPLTFVAFLTAVFVIAVSVIQAYFTIFPLSDKCT